MDFLRRLVPFVVALLLALPQAAGSAPAKCTPLLLWGDGRHDDTLALNAWFRGDDVLWAETGKAVGPAITGRTFRLSAAVYVSAGTDRSLERFRLTWPERGETVAGGAIRTGGEPAGEPVLTGVSIVGGDSGEGVPFDAADPGRDDEKARTSCLIS